LYGSFTPAQDEMGCKAIDDPWSVASPSEGRLSMNSMPFNDEVLPIILP
jgi:hypothetical protein